MRSELFDGLWWAHTLGWGSLAAVITGAVLISVFLVAPYAFFSDYPADIRAAASKPTASDRRRGTIGGMIFMLTLLAGIFTVVFSWGYAHPGASFAQLAVMTFVSIALFVLVDLVFVDWLFICKFRPSTIVLEGTEDCAGWRDFSFHIHEQFRPKGLMVFVVGSVLVGGLAWLCT